MNKKIEKKKGFTLVELVIVLAVLVVAAGMVVTFSSMMHGAQSVSNARYEAMQDVRVAESLIEGFIENNEGNLKTVDNGSSIRGNKLCLNDDDNTSAFLANGGALVISGNEVIFLESLESIEFEIVTDKIENPTDTLYYCTITYDVADTLYTYTFCVNPYVGEGGSI